MNMIIKNRGFTKKLPYRDARLILIYCEGEKREDQYFSFFEEMSSRIKFEVVPSEEGNSSPNALLENAKKQLLCTNPKYNITPSDSIWFVVDTDRWRNHIHLLHKECHQNKWLVAQSNPSFEVWLYYHFQKFTDFGKIECGKAWKQEVHKISKGGFHSDTHPVYIESAIKYAKEKFLENEEKLTIGSTEVFKLAEDFFPLIKEEIEKLLSN